MRRQGAALPPFMVAQAGWVNLQLNDAPYMACITPHSHHVPCSQRISSASQSHPRSRYLLRE